MTNGLEKLYYDTDGNPVSLHKLIRMEPEWARNRILALEAQIEMLTKELGDLLVAKSISCTIPTIAMEQEFSRHYTRGWNVGMQEERARRAMLVALLKEAALCPELGGTLLGSIKAAIIEVEKLK